MSENNSGDEKSSSSNSKNVDSEMKRKLYEISMNTSTKFLRSQWSSNNNKTSNLQSDIAEGLLIQKIPKLKKETISAKKIKNEDFVQNIDKTNNKLNRWNLPYELSSCPIVKANTVSFSLSEKMKYNKMESVINSSFVGRYVAVKSKQDNTDNFLYKIGVINKINKISRTMTIDFNIVDTINNIETIEEKEGVVYNTNEDNVIYLIEFAYYYKKQSSLCIIVSNYITKELLISRNEKDNIVYSGFIIPNNTNLWNNPGNKTIELSNEMFTNDIPSSLLMSITSIPSNQVPITTISFCFSINNVYSTFLESIEFFNVSISSLPRYILYEISVKNELYLLLSFNSHFNTFLLRKFSNNQLEWTTLPSSVAINIMKGPALLVSVQKQRSCFWTALTFKNTKAISIYDNSEYETNISIRKKSGFNYNVLCLVECAKCMYCIANYEYYICYSCCKVFHSNCLDKSMRNSILINGAFSCDDCRPCFNCKANSNIDKLTCVHCGKAYHINCLLNQLRYVYSDFNKDKFKCENCISCLQCGVTAYTIKSGNRFNSQCEMCIECEHKRNKRQFCPICDELWTSIELDNLIECKCKFFYHVKCDRTLVSGTAKKKYHCPSCRIKKKIKFLDNFLKNFIALDENLFFIEPVDTKVIPNYTKVIKKPMCFKMIEEKIKDVENVNYLKNMNEFFEDIDLISTNAIVYNKPNDFIYKVAEKLKKDSEKILNDNFGILYQISFEYYLFDYTVTNQGEKKKNQNLSEMQEIVDKFLTEKFSKELIEKMGINHIQSKIDEYEIDWEMLSKYGLSLSKAKGENSFSKTLQIPIEDIEIQNCPRHQKFPKNNDLLLELDLYNSNFDIQRKSTRTVTQNNNSANAVVKMEINETNRDKDPNDINLREEENDILKEFEYIKAYDKKISFLYPNKYKDYSIKKNDKQSFIDFITSFILKKEEKRNGNKNRKTATNNTTRSNFYIEEDKNTSDKKSDNSSEFDNGYNDVMARTRSKKTKRKATESSINDISFYQNNISKKKKTSNNTNYLKVSLSLSPPTKKGKGMGQVNLMHTISETIQVCFNNPLLIFEKNCFLCGSFDAQDEMIQCANCSDSYHYYCISSSLDLKSVSESNWRCEKCKLCEICNGNEEKGYFIICIKCNSAFHSQCLEYPLFSQCEFKCSKCFKCKNCGTSKYYNATFSLKKEKDYSFFTRNFSYCFECGLKLFHYSLCGKCEISDFKSYNKKLHFISSKSEFDSKPPIDTDNEVIMIYCHQCFKWYHCKCIGYDYFSLCEYYRHFEIFRCLDCALITKYEDDYNEVAYVSYLEVLKTSFKLMCLSKMMMIILKKYQINSSVKLHTKLIKMFLKDNYRELLENKSICMLIELIKIDVYLLRDKKEDEEYVEKKEDKYDFSEIEKFDNEIMSIARKEIYMKGAISHKYVDKNRQRYDSEQNRKNAMKRKINYFYDSYHHRKSFRNKILDFVVMNNIKDFNCLITKINISKLQFNPYVQTNSNNANNKNINNINDFSEREEKQIIDTADHIQNCLKKRDESLISHLMSNFFKNKKVIYTNGETFPDNIVFFYNFDLKKYFTPSSPSYSSTNIFYEIYQIIQSLSSNDKGNPRTYQKKLNSFLLRVIFSSVTFLRTILIKWLLNQLTSDSSFVLNTPQSLSPTSPSLDLILQDDFQFTSDEEITKYLDLIDPILPSPNSSQKCEFCQRTGPRSRSGRLIHVKDDLWCHVNCAYWSKGVTESNSFLHGVSSIINKLSQYKCLLCKKGGGTIVCHVPKCGRPFHFICALAKGSTFTSTNNVYCNRCTHSQKDDTDAVLNNNTKKLFKIEKKNDNKYSIGLYNRFGSSTILKLMQINGKDYSYENIEFNVLKIVKDNCDLLTICDNICMVKRMDISSAANKEKIHELISKSKANNCFSKTTIEDIEAFTGESSNYNILIKIPFDATLSVNYCPNKQKRWENIEAMLKTLETEITSKLSPQINSNAVDNDIIQNYFNLPFNFSMIFNPSTDTYLQSILNTSQNDSQKEFTMCQPSHQIQINSDAKSVNETMSIASSTMVPKPKRSSTSASRSKLETFISIMKSKNKTNDIDENLQLKHIACFKFVNYIDSHQQFLTGRRQTNEMNEVEPPKKAKSKQTTYKNQQPPNTNLMEYNLPLPMKYRNYKMQGAKVAIGPSRIHRNGLFAMDNFTPGEIVIEYVGEVITNKIADFREKEYNLRGFGDCYMFRVDAEKIIDATKYGNLARFINHSCDPNCNAESNKINGRKHILLYAKKFIKIGEEITYDYNFESETEKIQCRCGAPNCQGRLN